MHCRVIEILQETMVHGMSQQTKKRMTFLLTKELILDAKRGFLLYTIYLYQVKALPL